MEEKKPAKIIFIGWTFDGRWMFRMLIYFTLWCLEKMASDFTTPDRQKVLVGFDDCTFRNWTMNKEPKPKDSLVYTFKKFIIHGATQQFINEQKDKDNK